MYQEYADLSAQIEALTSQREEVRDRIISSLDKAGLEKNLVEGVGKFSISCRKVWSYSEAHLAKKEALKKLEAKEQENGKAKFSETRYITFTPAKI